MIVGFKAGGFYAGKDEIYRDLTITHAEFRAALKSADPNRRLFTFIRKEVWDFYKTWKTPIREGKAPISWEIDRIIFPLLEDVEKHIPWTDTFDTSLDLKNIISQKIDFFVSEQLAVTSKDRIGTASRS